MRRGTKSSSSTGNLGCPSSTDSRLPRASATAASASRLKAAAVRRTARARVAEEGFVPALRHKQRVLSTHPRSTRPRATEVNVDPVVADSSEMLSLPIVEVHWVDSTTVALWAAADEVDDVSLECRTVGFLVRDLEDRVVISTSVDSNGHIMDPLIIPKGCITAMYDIEVGGT